VRSITLTALACACTLAISGCGSTLSGLIQTTSSHPSSVKKTPRQLKNADLYLVKFTPTGDISEIRNQSGNVILLNDFTCPQLPDDIPRALGDRPRLPARPVLTESDVKLWIDQLTQSNDKLQAALHQAVELYRYCSHDATIPD